MIHTVFPFPLPGITHGYSKRHGGVSPSPYESLNLGDHVGDDLRWVYENRVRFSHLLGVPDERWVTAEQVHGCRVARVDDANAGTKIPDVDALITDTPDLPLALMYADCASLYLVDPKRRAIGLAHAGWRGTASEIALNTLEAMVNAFESATEELYAGLGPHIGPCCYAVGPEVVQAFEKWPESLRVQGDETYADLGTANRAQLISAGVREDRIFAASPCTSCNIDEYFSYRRDGTTGRMAAVLMLDGNA